MTGQMCWLSRSGGDTDKVLHLRLYPNQSWQPYTAFRQYAVPDYPIPGGSKGWATYQKLLKNGWVLIKSSAAEQCELVVGC
ncbi:MAG TPA: hypothetical protein DDZ80_10650 [Cyanobacteria bacterium UBA8803]|nr:hypothetical protein [Cyanobacteria bacterium UBA9273]HBL58950.1 hypothetical protein [Cyanobacteria bacterium UBA8803]